MYLNINDNLGMYSKGDEYLNIDDNLGMYGKGDVYPNIDYNCWCVISQVCTEIRKVN